MHAKRKRIFALYRCVSDQEKLRHQIGNFTCGINTRLLDLTHNGVLATTNRLVLVVHDGSGACCRTVTQVTGESGNGGDNDDDTELAAFLAGTNAGIDDSPADLIVNRVLLLAGGSDWKIVSH